MLNNPYFDGAASIAIGVLLVGMSVFMLREARGLLVGEGASPEVLRELEALAGQDAAVSKLRAPLTMYLGPADAILALDIAFQDHLTAVEIEQAVERLQTAIKGKYPEFQRIFIEAASLNGQQRQKAAPLASG